MAAVVLLIFIGIPIGVLGLQGALNSIHNDTWLWLVMLAMFAFLIGLILRFAFPPKSWHARLEFMRGYIRFVPVPTLRWIGEPTTEISLSQQASEILLCRGSRDNSPLGWSGQGNFPYGFRVFVRSADGHDRELKIAMDRLNPHQFGLLTEGITAATGLPVRIVQRIFAADGSFHELPWAPSERSTQWSGIAKMAFAAAPFLVGIIVGLLHSDLGTVVVVGIALWLCQTLAAFSYAHVTHQKSKLAALYWFSTLFTFAASYAFSIVLAFYALNPK